MARNISALVTELANSEIEPFFAVEALFDDDDDTRYDEASYTGENAIRLWTGYGNKTIASNTYTGSGDLLGIDGLEETNDLSARAVTIALSGIDTTIVSLALTEPYQRRLCRIYFGSGSVAPVEVFSGFMNTMTIEDNGETSSISLTIESKLVALERASNRRYTHENHLARNSSDTFFSVVADLQDKDIVWGRDSV